MKNIRILGVDDSHFTPHTHGTVMVAGVVMRVSGYIDGFLTTSITIDGTDATEKIAQMARGKYHRDIRVIMTQGITFGGFNVLDIRALAQHAGAAVIVVSRKKPNLESMREALKKHFPDWKERYALLTAVPIEKISNGEHALWIQRVGIESDEALQIIHATTVRGAVPEPVRLAHLMASAIYFGESKGKP
ncbi:MAG: DUF99 family protein [Euryarchaeota archaeon]|nr:DUF99 family protein [Euryarchaeota archaeon]